MFTIIDYTQNCKNFNSRLGLPINIIVFHTTDAPFASAVDWLCNPKSNVSAHYVISREGVILNLVKEDKNAWHCGNAEKNRRSIGIEIEAYKGSEHLTLSQELSLTWLVRQIKKRYVIPENNLFLHRWIKATECPICWSDDEFKDYRFSHFG